MEQEKIYWASFSATISPEITKKLSSLQKKVQIIIKNCHLSVFRGYENRTFKIKTNFDSPQGSEAMADKSGIKIRFLKF